MTFCRKTLMETRSVPLRSFREIERVSCWEFSHPRSQGEDMHAKVQRTNHRKVGPSENANWSRRPQQGSILYSLGSSREDDQLLFLIQSHWRSLREETGGRRIHEQSLSEIIILI